MEAATTVAFRDEPLEAAMATVRRAVDLARTLRSQAGLRVRQPLEVGDFFLYESLQGRIQLDILGKYVGLHSGRMIP